uniref:Huntingtin associated protein 1 n=1 Tax=Moschus moschiferus TaxID=68415 RepID=A0A8C6FP25_MOSMO
MRPKVSGPGSARNRPGPGDPAAVAAAPLSATSPAPEPSAVPEPASAQAPAAGQRAGSGFAASVPDNSDASRTRFIFQGPSFGPRATGLGTGKATNILTTPAAYIGQRPGVSGLERAVFIRELEEVLCPDLCPLVKKITQEEVKMMLSLLEERERDLNMTACIGQSLVKQNSVLLEENSKLEAMLHSAKEEILHLRQQVSLRDDLLQLYSDSDEEEDEDEEEEEEEEEDEEEDPCTLTSITPSARTPVTESASHHCPQLEALREQLRLLEEENEQLREEADRGIWETEGPGEPGLTFPHSSPAEASQQMAELSEVLALRMENYEHQRREVAQLQVQVMKLERRCRSRVGKMSGLGALGSHQSLWAGPQLQDLQEKYSECGDMLMEAQEEVKTLRQQAPASAGSVIHYTYTVPLEALPDFQETLAEELRMSIRRIISDPVFLMERCTLGRSPLPAGEGLMPAEDFVPAEELVPEEELGAIEEAVPAEERVTEESELVSEEAEAWEDLEPEADEATQVNMVTSVLEASSLGPSHLDTKYVLQQLASWQDANFIRRQLRQKMLQKGKCSRGGLPLPGVPNQDFRRLKDEVASHTPKAWEEGGPSWTPPGNWDEGLCQQGPQSELSPG